MQKKGIVILGAGLLQKSLIQGAKEKGFFVIICDKNPQALSANEGDIFLEVSTRNTQQLIEALKPYEGKFHYSATLGTDMTPSIAGINRAYSLPGLLPEQAEVTTRKGKMRSFIKSLGMPQPEFMVTKNRIDAMEWVHSQNNSSGFVIKPIHNMGARGVMYFKDMNELSFAFEFAQSEAIDQEVIIEEYIKADELSVDALSIDGKVFLTGLADRNIELKDDRFFIETGHTMPTQRHPEAFDPLKEELQKISDGLGKLVNKNYTGALKGDIRITPSGKIIIGEVATRLSGGFMSTHTYPLSSGNNLVHAYLDILEGNIPEFIREGKESRYPKVCIERAVISQPGIVKRIQISSEINLQSSKLENLYVHYQKGDLIESLQSNLGKAANVIISSESFTDSEKSFQMILQASNIDIAPDSLTENEISWYSRKYFNRDFCRVCKVCDGVNCASSIPGMGGPGKMNSFKDNIRSLSEIKIIENQNRISNPVLSSKFLNIKLPFPILNAPITGSITNMGGSITEYDHAIEISMALRSFGLPSLFGDGADPYKYFISLEAIRQSKGGFLVIKPRANNQEIIDRIKNAQKAGADGWGIDIDSVKLITMKNKGQIMAEKNSEDFKEITKHTSLPFFIKGIMTPEEGLEAASWGASAIIISNHGGRVDDNLPGTSRVISEISKKVKEKYPDIQIFTDGGIRSGKDVFKMISLGADGVLIGRPLTIAAVGAGRVGVSSIIRSYRDDLIGTMETSGTKSISDIKQQMCFIQNS